MSVESAGQHLLMRQCISLSGLMVLLLDFVICFEDEYKHLWKAPPFPTREYISYSDMFQFPISVYSLIGPLSKPPIPQRDCFMWFNMQMSFAQVTITLTSARKMGLFLLALFAMDNLQSTAMCVRAQTRLTFDERCVARDDSYDPYIYATSVLVTQATIWWLTWRKRALAKQFRIPLVRVAIRDGAWAFAGIAVLIGVIIPYSSAVEVDSEIQLLLPMIVYSIVGCRVIINMQKIPGEDAPTSCEVGA
ncbi:hypothetical protein BDQ17DRAFT_1364489, partial [Cyathus striatus]